MIPPTRTAIIGNRASVMTYCRENNINPRDRNYILVSSYRDVQGISGLIEEEWVGPIDPMHADEIYRYIKMINARYS